MSTENPFAGGQDPQGMPPQQPQFQQAKGSNGLLIGCIVLAAMIPLMGICAGLLLPAVQAAREAARRMACSNNMKNIGLALHNYHSANGSLPPAYTVDANGNRLHSWRTLILPYMEQQALYQQIDLSKPWDDPVNAMVSQVALEVYRCPSTHLDDPGMTTYVAVVDPASMMSGATPRSFQQVSDGLASTVMIVETDSANAVHWMSPDDIDLPTFLSTGTAKDAGGHIGGANVLMGDGAVIFVTDTMDDRSREAMVTVAGGDGLDFTSP